MQYKAAMERIFGTVASSSTMTLEDNNSSHTNTQMIRVLLYGGAPLSWLLLASFVLSVSDVLTLWYMPCLGILAACLANAVPIGGGIVYVPAFMVYISAL